MSVESEHFCPNRSCNEPPGNKLLTCVPSGSLAQLERWVEQGQTLMAPGLQLGQFCTKSGKTKAHRAPRPDLIHLEVRAAFDGLQTTS